MQTDMGEGSYAPGAEEKPLYTAEPLTLEDLKLLADLFYLPYEHGPTARSMLQELHGLTKQSAAASAGAAQVGPPALAEPSPAAGPCIFMLAVCRRLSGAPELCALMTCVRRWCRCLTACPTRPTAALCTTSTTTSVTSKVGFVWLEPT